MFPFGNEEWLYETQKNCPSSTKFLMKFKEVLSRHDESLGKLWACPTQRQMNELLYHISILLMFVKMKTRNWAKAEDRKIPGLFDKKTQDS